MPNNYPPEVAASLDKAKEAAENTQTLFKKAEDQLHQAAAELEAQDRCSGADSKVDPTLDIRMKTSSTLSRLAERAAEHVEKARRAADFLKRATDSAEPSERKSIAEAAEKAAGDRDTAELWKTEIKKLAENARKEADAAKAAEGLLNLEKFFTRQKSLVYERLEHYDEIAKEAGANSDMVFIAESLPVINGIINVGSTQEDYNKAIEWVKKKWGHTADPLLVLSALVFIYVVDRGAIDHKQKDDIAKQATWENIRERVRRLL